MLLEESARPLVPTNSGDLQVGHWHQLHEDTGCVSHTALQELLDTIQAAAQHSHISHVRPAVSLAVGLCPKQDGSTRILWEVQSAAALQQAIAMCCRLHEGRAELSRLRQTGVPCVLGCLPSAAPASKSPVWWTCRVDRSTVRPHRLVHCLPEECLLRSSSASKSITAQLHTGGQQESSQCSIGYKVVAAYLTKLRCTPRLLCTPAQARQMNTP